MVLLHAVGGLHTLDDSGASSHFPRSQCGKTLLCKALSCSSFDPVTLPLSSHILLCLLVFRSSVGFQTTSFLPAFLLFSNNCHRFCCKAVSCLSLAFCECSRFPSTNWLFLPGSAQNLPSPAQLRVAFLHLSSG